MNLNIWGDYDAIHCLLLSKVITEPNFNARKFKFIELHTHPLIKPFMINAQSANKYFSEIAINAFELKDSWQQLFGET